MSDERNIGGDAQSGAKRPDGALPDGALPDGALLRAAADGELSETQGEQLDRYLARSLEGHARVQFERELREAVGRVMGEPVAPESLRASVRRIVEGARDSEPAPELKLGGTDAPAAGSTAITSMGVRTRKRSFWANRQVWAGALAAVVVFGVASALVWQATRLTGVHLTSDQLDYRSRLVGHVAGEHRRVIDPQVAASKLSLHDPEEVRAFFQQVVGTVPGLEGLTVGTPTLVFAGVGNCHVPGSNGSSAHLRFDLIGADGGIEQVVSVFIKADHGELPMDPGVTYTLDTKACGQPGTRVLAWSDGTLVYYLVADVINDGCVKLLKHLGVPTPSRGL